ncbi:2-hydroxychromene-2-carboxylate isomerase [Burkholderia alba]|uniref:2-hydroxychromene-2-carboxylate isomerase n=1 Tax=Burkholderia alba TaxID=2683677 RepID=UPI002B0524E6|nr:2-hydroxychromene-2-carboxylate isomerase [Burkholderia alba]
MSKRVDFYFDVGSPASYLAWTQLPTLCRTAGAELVCKPMLLGGVFQRTGNASPMTVPAKARYVNHDLQRYARRYDVPLAVNPHFPIITLFLMRVVTGIAAQEPDRLHALLDTVFKAIWVDALDLNKPELTAQVLSDAGFDPQRMLAFAGSPEIKEALKAATQEAIDRGVFGAPTFFVGDEMFFGQDRLEMVRDELTR